ncbi:hypothetical protein BSK49_10745 [Paenibacillus odorifer]|uniref:hypothetical protein n=1 Tax=Paenibacillus odorifer TaxID=189426 RepID=UPI00096F54F9|nr:hypothetical protein [Paenibacillus odorifer]OMD89838.1 hypothetical protein BSK49_10745 [Paenibacillus odorifer]
MLIQVKGSESDNISMYRRTNEPNYQSLIVEPKEILKLKKNGDLFRQLIDDEALSFSTKRGMDWVTTMDAVNATGILIADQDGTSHVSVYPTPWAEKLIGDVDDWLMTFQNANTNLTFIQYY